MKNKYFQLFPLSFLLLLALWPNAPVFAYQVAEGNLPATVAGEKYIFYWGKMQCDLTKANSYQGAYSCTAAGFRQLLHSDPHLWTGAQMAGKVSFKLENLPVQATRGAGDYTAIIGMLDEAIGQKVVPGQTLRITDLYLDEQTVGRIDLLIEAPEPAKSNTGFQTPPAAAANMLNTRFLQQVVWGREDIYENANRDFFSETEFWRTVQQLPVVDWAPYSQPQAIRAGITFHDPNEAAIGLRATLEAQEYQQMVENLNNYRHLLKPGTVVSLTLHTVDQYERLYEKNMYIVAADDPRLALRRDRDTHSLRIKWGGWEEKIDGLYLLELKNPAGNTVLADPVASVGGTMRNENLIAMQKELPAFWIDGRPEPDMTFRLLTPTDSIRLQAGQTIPDGFLTNQSDSGELYEIKIDSLEVAGYALSPLSFFMRFFYLPENLRVRNQLNSLLAAPGTALVKLHTPVLVGAGYAADLEALQETNIQLSIFKPDGENVFTLDNKYPIGRHTVEIPRMVFREPGKYYLFLNTIFGVAKQELVLE